MSAREKYVPALRFERLTALYDPVVRLTTRERTFKERLLDLAAIRPGERVLDLGCGTGTLAVLAKRRHPEAELVGLDGDPAVLERGRRKAAEAGVEVRFDEGLSDDLPYEDASFDVVLSTLLFHHLIPEVKERTSRELARVLRPGGRLHIADLGAPGDPLMRLLSLGSRALDGAEPTRDNLAGRLPQILEAGGLRDAREHDRLRTAVGSLAFYSARR